MAETISVEKSFELPTDKDWEYLGNEFINNIRIYDDIFQKYKDNILLYPRLQELGNTRRAVVCFPIIRWKKICTIYAEF